MLVHRPTAQTGALSNRRHQFVVPKNRESGDPVVSRHFVAAAAAAWGLQAAAGLAGLHYLVFGDGREKEVMRVTKNFYGRPR